MQNTELKLLPGLLLQSLSGTKIFIISVFNQMHSLVIKDYKHSLLVHTAMSQNTEENTHILKKSKNKMSKLTAH